MTSRYPVGEIAYRPGSIMAAGDSFKIVVHGMQTHGAYPWLGVDPGWSSASARWRMWPLTI